MFPFSQDERLVFSYIWLVGSRLFGIYLVIYVLGRATDRTEILIVTVAGMLFGVLSRLMYLQLHLTALMAKANFDSKLMILRGVNSDLDNNKEYKEEEDSIKRNIFHGQWKYVITSLTSLIIFVLCFMRFAPLFSVFGG